jgi:Acyl-CoA reductase (LuxC)
MSNVIHWFASQNQITAVTLPFELEELIGEWEDLRRAMIRSKPDAFTREEWAYLIGFLSRKNLIGVFEGTFGEFSAPSAGSAQLLARPRGLVAVWLPNNVSLLGPVMAILLSLTGNRLRLKGGTQSEDLTGVFLEFARNHLKDGQLKRHLEQLVSFEMFGREDARHAQMAAQAQARIVFGSDAAAQAIHALPHPLDSVGFSFVDRRSEAWIEPATLSDTLLMELIKVFMIYGQAGCTSPRRVVLLGATRADAMALSRKLREVWERAVKRRPLMYQASANLLAAQLAAARGWDVELMPEHVAVLATGEYGLEDVDSPLALMIIGARDAEEAAHHLPANIQTLGTAFSSPGNPCWLQLAARTRIKRIVPMARMHHFGAIWDGELFWQGMFETIEVSQ